MKILIQTETKTYPVIIGESALKQLQKHLETKDYTKVLVVTDEIVGNLHGERLKQYLPTNKETFIYQVPAGEKAKQFSVYEQVLSYGIEKGLDRKSCIIAFGGGAVGDLAGFVAATFMRGIPFIQVPTTILAHDSAVGGKTGINHHLGKNLIGAFHQPNGVFYDLEFLQTLPENQIRSGFAEVVKHALIGDPKLLQFLIEHIHDLKQIDFKDLKYMLKRGIEIKANVVLQDEREMGLRAILNFGHTLGHAIEATRGYGTVTHGEAVMTGIIYALYLSKAYFNLQIDIPAFEQWLKSLGYQLEVPKEQNYLKTLMEHMKRDKKSINQQFRFVLLKEIGNATLQEVKEEDIIEQYSIFLSNTII